MNPETPPPRWKILLAFAIIYFVWGSTFLAIRVGVHEIPPLLMAGMRFLAAGAILYAWMRVRGTPAPNARQWLGASLLGMVIFVMDYGCLFWAEKRVPSGITAVVLASIPVFMTVLEIVFLRTQRLTIRLGSALLFGIFGVSILMNHSFMFGEVPLDRAGTLVLLFASFSWSVAAIIAKRIPLPDSKAMSAASQMLSGGVQLFVISALAGEFSYFHPRAVSLHAWLALAYLIAFGSILGFTAYVWLLHYESPTKVGTYAYVNPIVAVALGYFAAGEAVGRRTLVGTLMILASVITITTTPKKNIAQKQVPKSALAEVN